MVLLLCGSVCRTLVAMQTIALMLPCSAQRGAYMVTLKVNQLDNGGSGQVGLQLRPDWCGRCVDRFVQLLQLKAFEGAPFYLATRGLEARFGTSGNGAQDVESCNSKTTSDLRMSNYRGRLSFVPDSKGNLSSQIHINLKSKESLDAKGFQPFAEVVEGMFNFDRLYDGYNKPGKKQPDPKRIGEETWTEYLQTEYPKLSYIESAELGPSDPEVESGLAVNTHTLGSIVGVALLLGALGGVLWKVFVWHLEGKKSLV